MSRESDSYERQTAYRLRRVYLAALPPPVRDEDERRQDECCAIRGFLELPEVCDRRPGLHAVHDHSGLHDHLAPGRDDDAHPEHHPASIRLGGFLICLQRRSVRLPRRWLCRPLRSQAPASILLWRLLAGYVAVCSG